MRKILRVRIKKESIIGLNRIIIYTPRLIMTIMETIKLRGLYHLLWMKDPIPQNLLAIMMRHASIKSKKSPASTAY